MQRIVWGATVVMIAALAGCGGGGGSAIGVVDPPVTLSPLSPDIVGTWQVQNLGVPNDEIIVQEDGDIVIGVTEPQTLSANQSADLVNIGTCTSLGVVHLAGRWIASGVEHSIDATGTIDPGSSKLSLQATVKEAERTVRQSITVTGSKGVDASDQASDAQTPPPPPFGAVESAQDMDAPPPPPSLSAKDPFDAPPPPPPF
ncbi:MAG: hypothetical protein ACYC64_05735 [Armatimonadota bacterium]